jgi:hypothetical protein
LAKRLTRSIPAQRLTTTIIGIVTVITITTVTAGGGTAIVTAAGNDG